MPPPARTPAPPPQELPVPSYPAVETFIEKASANDVQALFAPVKEELAGLKGPRAETGKKAQAAIARAEELLSMLVDVREKLVAESKQSKGRK
ncbi:MULTISPECIES: hypothetical protein [Corallococcus]|uniref:hypothetical protein n=1 Tax=Corallococcus TaxID=83461 RepID=UPI00117D9833|nr:MULTISPECIES: hypothetical protein [Corallococcus]NBD08652.1 hypothetical protein [Corallococcus silvisoli]TSC32623.1 hypothetical protein FOF48_06320 [Corallococcus sp. Z5C101001]